VVAFDVKDGDEKSVNTWHAGISGEKFASPKLYTCPSDPSSVAQTGLVGGEPATSYAYNLTVFWAGNGKVKIPASFPDGTSVTAFVYERYAMCGETRCNPWGKADTGGANVYGASDWVKDAIYTVDGKKAFEPEKNPFKKFQHQPRPADCSPTTAQSLHAAGINVLMGDASVKIVAPSVSDATWSAAVTPNAKDVVGPDW
jgi:hypothetical protein